MSRKRRARKAGELRLGAESIEALARRLAELIRTDQPEPAVPLRLLTAAEVSEWWGVDREWVYAHANQLGARRLGAGRRPRLRFDPEEVAERIAALGSPRVPDQGRSRPIPGDPARTRFRSRAELSSFGKRDGRAARQRPRPGAEGRASAR